MKNLDFALRALALVKTRVRFDAYGPRSEAAYWYECEQLIAALPPHVDVVCHGEIRNAAVPDALAACDLLFLPSRSENFGHAIFEALSCGVPVLIGDQTPWRDLPRKAAGWDLPLDAPAAFAARIDELAAMDEADRSRLRAGSRKLAQDYLDATDQVGLNRRMLNQVLAEASS